MTKKPIIGLPANIVDYNGSPGHIARDTYINALIHISDTLPVILPVRTDHSDISQLAQTLDGILLTGSPSHVAPACYGAEQSFDDKYLDLARDGTTLPLLRAMLDAQKPVLAICRGFQEMNVAMGGTLHQNLENWNDSINHRKIEDHDITQAYEHQAHDILRNDGGLFEQWNVPNKFSVNTIHQQGADRLGSGLHIEGTSPDGLIEAISVVGHPFALGVQWHPEGDHHINAVSRLIFEKFGQSF